MAVLTYKCKNCDGPLTFSAKKGKYVCDYCRSTFEETDFADMAPVSEEVSYQQEEEFLPEEAAGDDTQAPSQDTSQAQPEQAAAAEGSGKAIYICPSCGAQIMTEETTAASICYFCHNPVVLSDKLDGADTPDLVLPFEISEKEAKEIFKKWIGEHKYVPRDFYSASQIKLLSGVYFPYWIYDCDVQGRVLGRGEKIRTWDEGGMRNRETSVFRLFKEGTMEIRNVTRIALNKASKVLVESVMPFDLTKAKPFSMGYLQGYVAEIKDIEMSAMEGEIQNEVKGYAAEQIKRSAAGGYQNVSFEATDVDLTHEKWKYALMPVYTLTYHDRKTNELYYFSINGQTGSVCGELPTDDGALRKLFLKIALPVFAALLALFFVV